MAKANKTKKRIDVTIVSCPFCKAAMGVECEQLALKTVPFHLSRLEAAAIQVVLDKRDQQIYFKRKAA
jgi:hypothetical protein